MSLKDVKLPWEELPKHPAMLAQGFASFAKKRPPTPFSKTQTTKPRSTKPVKIPSLVKDESKEGESEDVADAEGGRGGFSPFPVLPSISVDDTPDRNHLTNEGFDDLTQSKSKANINSQLNNTNINDKFGGTHFQHPLAPVTLPAGQHRGAKSKTMINSNIGNGNSAENIGDTRTSVFLTTSKLHSLEERNKKGLKKAKSTDGIDFSRSTAEQKQEKPARVHRSETVDSGFVLPGINFNSLIGSGVSVGKRKKQGHGKYDV